MAYSNVGCIKGKLPFPVLSPLSGEVDKLGFLCVEARSGSPCPLLDTRDIFGLHGG
jgi:hypothetical protein